MAKGQITSGMGSGRVKKYYKTPGGTIQVVGLVVDGASVTARLEPAEGGTSNPGLSNGNMFSLPVVVPPPGSGRFTLVVEIREGNSLAKALRQQVDVVGG